MNNRYDRVNYYEASKLLGRLNSEWFLRNSAPPQPHSIVDLGQLLKAQKLRAHNRETKAFKGHLGSNLTFPFQLRG